MTDTETLIAKLNAPIISSLHMDADDLAVIRDALAMYRTPVQSKAELRDCLLELVLEHIDRIS